jgi:hypothetical protein
VDVGGFSNDLNPDRLTRTMTKTTLTRGKSRLCEVTWSSDQQVIPVGAFLIAMFVHAKTDHSICTRQRLACCLLVQAAEPWLETYTAYKLQKNELPAKLNTVLFDMLYFSD